MVAKQESRIVKEIIDRNTKGRMNTIKYRVLWEE